ncbi:MAG: toll/interleukin-1 receptor domain-containing protein, partial [Oscillospiraceae bacterium]|nr:toll/interleukin-1 receptor domain-containing protein [Oscillospiraceae bacterium]
MTIIKCKMCGGDIAVSEDKTFGTCEYCGSTMTLPKVSDDQRAALFNRGNHFRRQGEFDKALSVYENIVRENDADAEAHWCCALCRFGIEYVEDPNTYEYIPTCHRASFDSFLEDVDYLAALENSDGITKRQYQKDAAKIAEVQKGILATSQTEEPFDVFICYKETDDATKERTKDSIDAQEIYYQLTNEGYRVFFSRITLEDKAGAEYEPYIFAALNSAKVMVAVGSKPEYFNAVWVKNEWRRFLALMRKDRSKLLLPCYKGMDPYDLPEQLSVLQSYDMGKIGFMQDLIRGIKKIVAKDEPAQPVARQTVIQQTAAPAGNAAPLLRRAFMFLEDGDWAKADDFAEQVLNIEPENGEAYVAKLLAELQVRRQEDLPNCLKPFDGSNNFKKAVRFGDDKLSDELNGYIKHINERNENTRLTGIYNKAAAARKSANSESSYKAAAATFKTIPGFKDADSLAEQCLERAEVCRKDAVYASAKSQMAGNTVSGYEAAIKTFSTISGWKDADEQIYACQRKIEEIKAKEEADRLERERKEEADRLERERQAEQKRIAAEKAAKKRKKIIA